MAQLTFQQALAYCGHEDALAILASGQNPDGSTFVQQHQLSGPLPAGTNNIGVVGLAAGTQITNTPSGLIVVGDNPTAPAAGAQPVMDFAYNLVSGGQWSRERVGDTFVALNAQACATETPIFTPPAGRRFRIMSIAVTSNNAGNIVFRDNTAGTVIAVVPTSAGGGPLPLNLGNGILSAAAGNALTVTGPGASATVSGMIVLMTE